VLKSGNVLAANIKLHPLLANCLSTA
jgi:hypothetical protein